MKGDSTVQNVIQFKDYGKTPFVPETLMVLHCSNCMHTELEIFLDSMERETLQWFVIRCRNCRRLYCFHQSEL